MDFIIRQETVSDCKTVYQVVQTAFASAEHMNAEMNRI